MPKSTSQQELVQLVIDPKLLKFFTGDTFLYARGFNIRRHPVGNSLHELVDFAFLTLNYHINRSVDFSIVPDTAKSRADDLSSNGTQRLGRVPDK